MLDYEYKLKMIQKALNEIDPIGLIKLGCPKDEYKIESEIIAHKLNKVNIDNKLIQKVFYKQFEIVLSKDICKEIVIRIKHYLYLDDIINQLNELFKDKLTISNEDIIMKYHDKFIVRYKDDSLYINDKFYSDIKIENLLVKLVEFETKCEVIYVQYKNKHFGSYFKEITKSKYNYYKLRRIHDIEYIFDNKCLLEADIYLDLQLDEMIEMMSHQEIKYKYDKLYYSKDKRTRLVIYKNNINSYSYIIEKLVFVDKDERMFYGCYGFWELAPFCQNSFYQSLELLLKDISYIIDRLEMEVDSYDC